MTVNINVGKNFILSCDGTGTSVTARVINQSGKYKGEERLYTFAHYPKFTQALSRVLEEEIAISDAEDVRSLRGQLLNIEKRILQAGEKFACKGLCSCEAGKSFKEIGGHIVTEKEEETLPKKHKDGVIHRLPKSDRKPLRRKKTVKETLSSVELTEDRKKEIAKINRKA